MAERSVLLRIHGRVQGVGFRWNLCQEARLLGVNGWVRNRLDGTVEALAWGSAEAVTALVAWSHDGPPGAKVIRVDVREPAPDVAPEVEYQIGFEQRPTL